MFFFFQHSIITKRVKAHKCQCPGPNNKQTLHYSFDYKPGKDKSPIVITEGPTTRVIEIIQERHVLGH